jgi:hypothetical protein
MAPAGPADLACDRRQLPRRDRPLHHPDVGKGQGPRGRRRHLVGYLTAGATPVWLLASFAVLSLLYRAQLPTSGADPAPANAAVSADPKVLGAGQGQSNDDRRQPGTELLTKRAQAARVYADLSADGALVSAGQLAAAAGLSASYARALVAEFHARPPAAGQRNGRLASPPPSAAGGRGQER